MNNILKYFPEKIRNEINTAFQDIDMHELEEIRIRVQKPIILKFHNIEKVIRYKTSSSEIVNILQLICENSIYSYQNQIAEGYITLNGGHRVGISGSCVIENGRIININYINSLNFRISNEVIGCSNSIIGFLINGDTIYNTLIASPPGCGKTTLLRDIARQFGNGIKNIKFKGVNVGIVDERGEIASLYKGETQNDVGIKTDVMDNVDKAKGISMLIRSMSPQIIIADEIGKNDDIDSINYALCSGCKGVFTAHGDSFENLKINPTISKLIGMNVFEIILLLEKNNVGQVSQMYKLNKINKQYEKIDLKTSKDYIVLEENFDITQNFNNDFNNFNN